MKRKTRLRTQLSVAPMILALGIGGCATTTGSDNSTEVSGGCNPAVAAGIGAVVGALIGGNNNRGTGAAIGAAAGGLACIAWNYKTVQTKSAEQVNSAYRAANGGSLPAQPKVVSYYVRPDPSSTISAGNPMVIASNIQVVQGAGSSIAPVVEQQLVVAHNGKVISSAKKRADGGQGAGEYATRFTVNLPKGVPQGEYAVSTALYIDGVRVQERNVAVQVVMSGSGESILATSRLDLKI